MPLRSHNIREISVALIVNLFGGPGAGKSTTRADVFRILKQNHVNCEEVYEHAKKLTWSERKEELRCQPYILGKQLRDLEVLMDKVDVIITDSPILLCRYYTTKYRPTAYSDHFLYFCDEQFKHMGGINFFIERANPYQSEGRNQTAEQSDEVARELRALLDDLEVDYRTVPGNQFAGPAIAHAVLDALALQKSCCVG